MAVTLIAGLASAASAYVAAGFVLSTALWGAFAIGAGLSLVSRALTPRPDLGAQMAGQSVMTREAADSRKIIYGRARIGGNVVYLETTGADNKYLWLVVAVAGHEIDAYEKVYFNDKLIWNDGNYSSPYSTRVQIGFFKGDQTSADNTTVSPRTDNLVNASNNKWTDDHKLLDTAYMVVRLEYDQEVFSQGLPNISCVVRGKKVLDPSDDSTAWSQNPALCIYDYLRDAKYGLGESASNIHTSSVNAAKTICDEAVNLEAGGTQPRYTMDGVIDTGNSIKVNIENMTGAMIGRLVYSGGQFEIYAGEYVAPTVTIDESMMIGEISVQTKQSRRSAYNGVKGIFLSEEDNYVLADYPAQISSTYATQDGDPIYLDMPLPYTVNNVRAQRIAQLALRRSRQQESITIPCNLNALKFKIGDNISVTNTRLGYSAKVFEVVGYSMGFSSDQMVVNVDAIETASSIWSWDEDEEVFLGAGEVDIYDGTSTTAPASITVTADTFISSDGTSSASFDVSWPTSVDAFVDHYVVEWKVSTDSSYFSQATKTSPLQIVGLDPSKTYDVRVKAVNGLAVSSSYVSAQAVPADDNTAPNPPTSVNAKNEFEQATVSWVNPTAKDFSHVVVYGSNFQTSGFLEIGRSAGTTFTEPELGTGVTRYYKLKALDKTGNASVYSSVDSATTTQVPVGGIADDAVDTDQIADLAVDTDQIDNDAVTIAKVAASLQSTNYVSGSAGWKIQKSGVVEFEEATIRGEITANTGVIGGFTVGSDSLIAGANATRVSLSTADGIHLGHNTFASAPFRVDRAGALTASSGTIGGITLGADKIHTGTGTFNNANTGIYIDDSGQFSLKNKLSFNGTTLAIEGNITADNLNVVNATVTGSFVAANLPNIQDLNGVLPEAQLQNAPQFASFFRFTRTSGTSVAAPSDSDFDTEFGREPLENDQLVVTNTAPTPDTQAAYIRNGSSAWISVSDFIAGNLIVDGSIGADQIIANSIGADEIEVDDLSAINANMGAITAGSLNNFTNSPTAGSAPTGVQSGTAINLSSGSFTFGNASSFLYFNTSEGLVQGGLTPFNDIVSIYYQGSSAPSSPSDSSMTYSSTGSYSFTTNPPTGWTLGIPNTTDNIYVVQADIGRVGAGLVTASWGQVSLFRAATVTGTSLATSPSSITFFYANSNSTSPNSYSNTYTVTASGAYSHAMVNNAVVASGTWSSLNSGSVTVNEQSGDTGQFTVGSVTYQATPFNKIWSWTVTHTASGSTVSQSTRSLNPSLN